MKKIVLKIGGMTCSACSNSLEKHLNSKEGISNAIVNLVMNQALIEYDDDLSIDDLGKYISEVGFTSLGEFNLDSEINSDIKSKKFLIVYTILFIFVMYVSMGHMIGFASISFIDINKNPLGYGFCLFILSTLFLIYGIDIINSGINNIRYKSPNMDSLVLIGVITSYIYSLFGLVMVILGNYSYIHNLYFESICTVIYLVKLGRNISLNNRNKTYDDIRELVSITPEYACVKRECGEEVVTIDMVKKGDILISRPGDKIAVDGVIISGDAHMDMSFITG